MTTRATAAIRPWLMAIVHGLVLFEYADTEAISYLASVVLNAHGGADRGRGYDPLRPAA